MDPDTTLTDALAIARAIADGGDLGGLDGAALAEHVLALDEWIAKGGYLPARWRPDPAPRSLADRWAEESR